MAAIAAELTRLQDSMGDEGPAARRDRAGSRLLIRDAVAEIARRQAALDRSDGARSDGARTGPPSARVEAEEAVRPAGQPAWAPPRTDTAPLSVPRRADSALSAEVSRTFARFSDDLHAAIRETDARPRVEELGREVSRIGQAVEGLTRSEPAGEPRPEGAQAASGRPVPFDAVERQVAALETRLGRLAALPVAVTAPPELSKTLDDVRMLLQGLESRGSMASLESRLDDITTRIERGLAPENPAGLIENLGRRVDEVHASLRSQLAETAVDTRPLEGLVRGLSERLGQARAASADFEQLETAMRDVAAKIDAVGSDPRAVQAIEGHLTRLGERLDRSETSLKALDGVEQALGELFSQFEVTRQVAIDAAETAARTAARDTLRAALQNPSLTPRGTDPVPGLADLVARGLDDLRALQDSAEQRTQATLSDLRAMIEHLVQGRPEAAPAPRQPVEAEEPRRRRPSVGSAAQAAVQAAVDPSELLIEPGFGRNHAPRSEPRFGPEPAIDPVSASTQTPAEADGPATFIAAARRAAQAAQASVASAAAAKEAERKAPQPASPARRRRARAEAPPKPAGSGTMARAADFLARRRRPLLLGLAAIVLLVGALEVVKLGIAPVNGARLEASEAATPAPARTAAAEETTPSAAAAKPVVKAQASVPDAVLPPVAAPTPPPLPTFVAGGTKAPAPAEGISEGLRALAASGDAAAQYEVGLRYAEGRGVAREPRQAVAWFEKAAAQGLAPAQYRMGSSYEKGIGVDRDPALAMSWYTKAATAGNIRAMHNLAVMSAEGAGGSPDYAKAAQWFGKASSYGVRDSQFNLAILYARGLGIEQSLVQSYKWFAIAAAQGDEDSAKKRDEVAAKLDPAALATAKVAVEAYHVAPPLPAANEVTPPPPVAGTRPPPAPAPRRPPKSASSEPATGGSGAAAERPQVRPRRDILPLPDRRSCSKDLSSRV